MTFFNIAVFLVGLTSSVWPTENSFWEILKRPILEEYSSGLTPQEIDLSGPFPWESARYDFHYSADSLVANPVKKEYKVVKIFNNNQVIKNKVESIWLFGNHRSVRMVVCIPNFSNADHPLLKRFYLTDNPYTSVDFNKDKLGEACFLPSDFLYLISPKISFNSSHTLGKLFFKFIYINRLAPLYAFTEFSRHFSPSSVGFLKTFPMIYQEFSRYSSEDPITIARRITNYLNNMRVAKIIKNVTERNIILEKFMEHLYGLDQMKNSVSLKIDKDLCLFLLEVASHLHKYFIKLIEPVNPPTYPLDFFKGAYILTKN